MDKHGRNSFFSQSQLYVIKPKCTTANRVTLFSILLFFINSIFIDFCLVISLTFLIRSDNPKYTSLRQFGISNPLFLPFIRGDVQLHSHSKAYIKR